MTHEERKEGMQTGNEARGNKQRRSGQRGWAGQAPSLII